METQVDATGAAPLISDSLAHDLFDARREVLARQAAVVTAQESLRKARSDLAQARASVFEIIAAAERPTPLFQPRGGGHGQD